MLSLAELLVAWLFFAWAWLFLSPPLELLPEALFALELFPPSLGAAADLSELPVVDEALEAASELALSLLAEPPCWPASDLVGPAAPGEALRA